MIKQLSLPVLGLIVLAGTVAPAAADKGKTYPSQSQYTYGQQYSGGTVLTPSQKKQRKFQQQLDFETKAVWQNLRPSRFVD